MLKENRHSKHYSRCAAVQAIYQWQHTQHSLEEIMEQFATNDILKKADRKYFKKLVMGIIEHQSELDQRFILYLDRDITQVNPVELAIIRMAVFELIHCPELPYKVVINEALDITKSFGAEQSYKYINAVLDALVKNFAE
jgi:transcription antitermination protein NusB